MSMEREQRDQNETGSELGQTHVGQRVAAGEQSAVGTKLLHLPPDRSMGLLGRYIKRMSLQGIERRIGETIAPARGTVVVSDKDQVHFTVARAAITDLSPLANLAPDDIYDLNFAGTCLAPRKRPRDGRGAPSAGPRRGSEPTTNAGHEYTNVPRLPHVGSPFPGRSRLPPRCQTPRHSCIRGPHSWSARSPRLAQARRDGVPAPAPHATHVRGGFPWTTTSYGPGVGER